MRFAFIAAKMAEFPITVLCRVLEVSRAGFYASIGRSPPPRVIADEKLAVLVREAHEKSRRTYGSPRVQAELADVYGVHVSRKRIIRLMRQQGLKARAQAVQVHDEQRARPAGRGEPPRPQLRG